MDFSEREQPDLFGGADESRSEESLDAAIYARTSSPGQRHGYSINAQVRRCWDRCQQMGWTVTHVFRDEEISGKDKDRPMFQQLLTRAEAGSFDVVVFWKLDRFSRSLMHAVTLEEEFREWGVALHSITEQIDTTTPTGRFNFRNISSASEFERELIQQRSQMGMRELALNHKWPNDHPPLGYDKCADDTLSINETEATTVRRIFHRYIELQSMPKVAEELNGEGVSTKDGGDWNARAVSDILSNELYTGQYNIADVEEYVPDYQIIDKEMFEEATDVRTRFQQDENISREKMSEERKEKRVKEITGQFKKYLNQHVSENNGL